MSKNRLKLVKKQYTKKASYVVMRLYDELLLCYYYVNENNNLKWTTQETYKRYIYIYVYIIYIYVYIYIYIYRPKCRHRDKYTKYKSLGKLTFLFIL